MREVGEKRKAEEERKKLKSWGDGSLVKTFDTQMLGLRLAPPEPTLIPGGCVNHLELLPSEGKDRESQLARLVVLVRSGLN